MSQSFSECGIDQLNLAHALESHLMNRYGKLNSVGGAELTFNQELESAVNSLNNHLYQSSVPINDITPVHILAVIHDNTSTYGSRLLIENGITQLKLRELTTINRLMEFGVSIKIPDENQDTHGRWTIKMHNDYFRLSS